MVVTTDHTGTDSRQDAAGHRRRPLNQRRTKYRAGRAIRPVHRELSIDIKRSLALLRPVAGQFLDLGCHALVMPVLRSAVRRGLCESTRVVLNAFASTT